MKMWPFFLWLAAVTITLAALVRSSSPPTSTHPRRDATLQSASTTRQAQDISRWKNLAIKQVKAVFVERGRNAHKRWVKRANSNFEHVEALSPEEREEIVKLVRDEIRGIPHLTDAELDEKINGVMDERVKDFTEGNCGFPLMTEETWKEFNTSGYIAANLEEMVKARDDKSARYATLHTKDIGAWMWSKYAPSATSPNCYSSVPCEAPVCILIGPSHEKEERTAAYYAMKYIAAKSQAHIQERNAMKDASDHVLAILDTLVDEFTFIKQLTEAEHKINQMIDKYEVLEEEKRTLDILNWELEVQAKTEAYQEQVAWREEEKARKLAELDEEYEPWRWAGNIAQTGLILGGQAFGAAGGMASSSVASAAGSILKRHGALVESAHIDPFTIGALVAGVGVGILNTVNFIVGEDLAEEKAQITGGEVVPRPIFRPKPMPYIPEWREPINTKVGLIGASWRDRADILASLKSMHADGTLYFRDIHNALFKYALQGGRAQDGEFWLLKSDDRAFMQDHHIDFDTETVLRDSFIRASIATTVNYLWRASLTYISMANTTDCNAHIEGPQSLRTCLPEHPDKVFYPYSYTTHMELFDFPYPIFGKKYNETAEGTAVRALSSTDLHWGSDMPMPQMTVDYWDHPTSPPGFHLLSKYNLSSEDVVRESMLRYTAFGGRDGGNSGKIGDRTKLDDASVRGSGAGANPRDNAFLFDIPIADCPRGECVSPIDWPQLFNAPCMVGEEWYYSTDEPMGQEGIRRTEEFFTATGLGRHPRWEQICTDRCFGQHCLRYEGLKGEEWSFDIKGDANPYFPYSSEKNFTAWARCNRHPPYFQAVWAEVPPHVEMDWENKYVPRQPSPLDLVELQTRRNPLPCDNCWPFMNGCQSFQNRPGDRILQQRGKANAGARYYKELDPSAYYA